VSEVTAVIGNYNGAALLPDCISSLRSPTLVPREIVVVDAASTDASDAVATKFGAVFIRERNEGLGSLYNRGALESNDDYVFFANNDIALLPECLEALVAVLDAKTSAFAADARQLDWAGSRTIHARTTLTRGRLLREYLPGLHLDHNVWSETVAPTVCANGAAMLVRREMFNELGGFDPTFFMEWEDLDLCWRARLCGWPTLYVPEAVVRHRVGAVTTRKLQPARSASSHHNLMRFALKCFPRRAATRVVLGEALRLPAHPRAISRGFAALASELPDIRRERARLRPSQAVFEEALRR
jgi:N-acetylglucosaminyl-diphospho-decaprenol L-rhamnosyltransferase